MNTIFSERLRSALLDRGWSQVELARRAGLDPGHVSRYVHGKITPQQASFKKVLDALGMTEREFMAGERVEPDEAQLNLLCEIEVLLGLAKRVVEMTRAGSTAEQGAPSPDGLMFEVTIQAMEGKVSEIRQMVRPMSQPVIQPNPPARQSEPTEPTAEATAVPG